MLAPSGGGLILYQAYDNLYAMTVSFNLQAMMILLHVCVCLGLPWRGSTTDVVFAAMVVKVALRLCVYYSATTISCQIVVVTIDPYLGGASRRRACSHGRSHTLFSCSAISNPLSYMLQTVLSIGYPSF
nr:hypothetical protein [Tanacetum cinerariifolium]